MNILLWILFGAIAGWLATNLMGGGMGLIGDIIVGILGAFVGGFLFSLLGGTGVTGFNLYSIIVATLGAMVLLFIVGKVRAA